MKAFEKIQKMVTGCKGSIKRYLNLKKEGELTFFGERALKRDKKKLIGLVYAAMWLKDFRKKSSDYGPVQFVNHLTQMGVETFNNCSCKEDWNQPDGSLSPEGEWIHRNHRLYNRAVWEIMVEAGMIQKARRVLLDDSKKPSQFLDGVEYGKFVTPKYRQELLDNFINTNPSSDWVGEE